MRVFGAMLLDAYRELNSKRLFWVVLGLSIMFVLTYGSIGFGEDGMSMLFGLFNFENEYLTQDSPLSRILYRSIFSTIVVPFWLAWIATILALISTTTIFPDFMAGGSIDIVLAKPISRVALFFLKYVTSLLFVLLQVTIFCVGIFLCMGVRLDDWEWKLFAAIPVVVLFYSYLFSVNVLLGVMTRSALAALLLTLLLWFSLYSINQAEGIINMIRMQMVIAVEEGEESIALSEERVAALRDVEDGAIARARIEREIESQREDVAEQQEGIDKIDRWYRPIKATQAGLPKTSETIALLDRWLKRDTDVSLVDFMSGNVMIGPSGAPVTTDTSRDRETMRRMEASYEAKSEWYVIGTSLIFEGVVLALACFVFVRRDY